MHRTLALAAMLALAACGGASPPAGADGIAGLPHTEIARSGAATVRATLLPTDRMAEPMARQYGIARGEHTVLLLVSVRTGAEGEERSLPARVRATVTDLQGRARPLVLRELKVGEGDAALVDHAGTFVIEPPETLSFALDVQPQGAPPLRMQFSRDFAPR
ncbi:MAG TPA: DUF4426 domain-containing protein [Lysobacter sp.]|nr:DUF4426 domain-containing protein [Lysobacter sp.]